MSKDCSLKVGSTKIGVLKVSPIQPDAIKTGSLKEGSRKPGSVKVGVPKVGPIKVSSLKGGSHKIGSHKVRFNVYILFSPFIPGFYSCFQSVTIVLLHAANIYRKQQQDGKYALETDHNSFHIFL